MMRDRLEGGRRPWRVVVAVAAMLAVAFGAPIAVATPAAAVTPTYTWTGFDADQGINTNWSDGANWAGGVAPSAPGPVNLVFPRLAPCALGTCGQSSTTSPASSWRT
jgi:hypothetical protein